MNFTKITSKCKSNLIFSKIHRNKHLRGTEIALYIHIWTCFISAGGNILKKKKISKKY